MRQLGVIEDGALLISDGIITNVGPTRRIENLAEARVASEEINASGRVVMPGFVDSHTHLIAAPPRVGDLRNSGDRSPSKGAASYNAEHIRRTSGPSLAFQAKRHLQGFLRHGTTTVEVKTGYGLDETGEMKMLRVIAQLAESGFGIVPSFLTPHTPPPEFTGNLEAYLVWIRDHVLPKVKTRRLAQFVDTFCDPSGYSVEHANLLLQAARRLGFETKIHAEQSVRLGAVRMAVEMGATSIDGLNQIDKSDAMVLGQSQTIGVVMPGPTYQGYDSRMPPARMLIDEGAALALASGFNPSVSATYNMMTVIAIACTHMGMTIEEAITATTINGAFAVMSAPRIGSLVFGKDADLIMLGVSDYREIPYQFGLNLVALTMRKGQVIYREGAVEW
ncbi:MAG TPA: imidazolonepropionase [Bryobacteraceae bacterium]|nr:imidazolonepropionase [Bryobacteraceae bacterium]